MIPRMLMFTLAISCLTSSMPWFMDLTFQVPTQYCSLQHRTLLLSLVTSTTGCCFCFGSTPSFFLELFLHWSPVAYWAPTALGSLSFSVLSFCLFILFMGFSRQENWSGLPFPSPVDLAAPAEKKYPMSKVRSKGCTCWSSHKEKPHVQGNGNPSKTGGTKRGHQRADRLKPKSQKTSQSDHMDPALSNSMKLNQAVRVYPI